jgi:osmotically-inducible protein OsmY
MLALGASDASIERSLRARLGRSKLRQDGLTFQVRNGAVEWQGQVSVPQRKGAATRMAKAAGAIQVINKIRIADKREAAPAAKPRVVTVTRPERR